MLGILGGEGKQENKNEVQEMENYGAEAGSAVKLLEELLNLGGHSICPGITGGPLESSIGL